jgi:hypothetical protein
MDGFRQLQSLVEKEADHLFVDIFTAGLNQKTPPPSPD